MWPQVLESHDKKNYHSVQHWGRTGTKGQVQVAGPMDCAAAVKLLQDKFREKTGVGVRWLLLESPVMA